MKSTGRTSWFQREIPRASSPYTSTTWRGEGMGGGGARVRDTMTDKSIHKNSRGTLI